MAAKRFVAAGLAVLITTNIHLFADPPPAAPASQTPADRVKQAEARYPIDPYREPLAAALDRLKLWKPDELEGLLSTSPTRVVNLLKLDKDNKPIFVMRRITGWKLREGFANIKASSISDTQDAETRKSLKELIATVMETDDSSGPIFPINPKRERLAARLMENDNFTDREKRHLELFEPNKTYEVPEEDDHGKPVPLLGRATGIALRQAFALGKMDNVRKKLDPAAREQWNSVIYGSSEAPDATDLQRLDAGTATVNAAFKMLRESIAFDERNK